MRYTAKQKIDLINKWRKAEAHGWQFVEVSIFKLSFNGKFLVYAKNVFEEDKVTRLLQEDDSTASFLKNINTRDLLRSKLSDTPNEAIEKYFEYCKVTDGQNVHLPFETFAIMELDLALKSGDGVQHEEKCKEDIA